MSTTSDSSKPKYRRRKYLVDPKLQLAVAFHLLGMVLGVGVIYFAATFIIPDAKQLALLPPEDVREMLLRSNLMFLSLSAGMVFMLAILLTHRIAGPMRVIEHAVQGMRQGDFRRRLTLRKRDYMKSLAAEVAAFRAHIEGQANEQRQVLEDLDRCIQENDLPAARELVARLRDSVHEMREEPEPVEVA